jgi:ABC-type multidrug transport system ATPase subunit
MEEAESLCDKIGIITNGHLRTVGNQHQLKKKYGDGYSLTICV